MRRRGRERRSGREALVGIGCETNTRYPSVVRHSAFPQDDKRSIYANGLGRFLLRPFAFRPAIRSALSRTGNLLYWDIVTFSHTQVIGWLLPSFAVRVPVPVIVFPSADVV